MSVFTSVHAEQLSPWLLDYDVGVLQHLSGITGGVQNSNFFVGTNRQAYVLTLFERVPSPYLTFYLSLMKHLATAGLPCPLPIVDRQQQMLKPLNGRPAALFSRLYGQSPQVATPKQCAAVGEMLAHLHRTARDWTAFPLAPPHPCGLDWLKQSVTRLLPHLSASERALLEQSLAEQAHPHSRLPDSIIHADLFRDNVLFEGERITGVLDFYFAGTGECLFDLAIAANDWCSHADGALDPPRVAALLRAYHDHRPLNTAEQQAWPRLLRAAALRFWVSRLIDFHYPDSGEKVSVRDPNVYRLILQKRAQTDLPWLH